MGCEGAVDSSPEMVRILWERLLDGNQPISERFRALFSLRNLRGAGPREALIRNSDCVALLKEFTLDLEPIVSQSCGVALSMLENERSGMLFEYLLLQKPVFL